MAANGISTRPFKRQRQDEKLALAAAKRGLSGRRASLDPTQLPTRYKVGTNTGLVDNPNPDGLIEGRPWTES